MSYPLAVFVPEFGARSETFIRRHVQDLLPGGTLAIGGPVAAGTVRDWDADGPLIDMGAVASTDRVAGLMADYGVEVVLGEYLDASLPWLAVAQRLDLRFVVHGHGYDLSWSLRQPLYQREYLRYRSADAVVVPSEYNRRRLIDVGLSPETTHAVPYGIDIPDLCPESGTSSSSDVIVVAVGRMVAKKAPLLTLEAFQRAAEVVPKLRLEYIGGGPLLPAAVEFRQTMSRHEEVKLWGGQPHGIVEDLMRSADIFVQHSRTVPETGDEEGLPVALLEAMAAGLPVVSTLHAGIPEAVEDGVTGFLVAEGDTRTMADRIARLARDASLRQKMGRAGWCRARDRFSWNLERRSLLKLLGLADRADAFHL